MSNSEHSFKKLKSVFRSILIMLDEGIEIPYNHHGKINNIVKNIKEILNEEE